MRARPKGGCARWKDTAILNAKVGERLSVILNRLFVMERQERLELMGKMRLELMTEVQGQVADLLGPKLAEFLVTSSGQEVVENAASSLKRESNLSMLQGRVGIADWEGTLSQPLRPTYCLSWNCYCAKSPASA
jgi:hypothetical protein